MSAPIYWIVSGLIIGALARLVLSGSDSMSLLSTMILGLGGSIVGGFIGNLIGGRNDGEFQPAGLVGSLIGAILLLLIVRRFRSNVVR